MSRRFLLSLPVLAALLLLPAAARADESITASPTTQRAESAAGGTFAGQINVINSGTNDFNYKLTTAPYSVQGEDYRQSFILQPDMIDASRWFSFSQPRYSLKTHSEFRVPYEIKVPAGVGPGGYYAVLFAETLEPSGSGAIKSKKRVGEIFYITVTGDTKLSGSVASFSVPAIHTAPPLNAVLRLRNDGNVHYEADIEIEIKDIFGNTKAIIPASKFVLPSTIRRIGLTWDKAPAFGLFRVEGRVKYNGKTEQLPASYTLMLSSTAFVVMFIAVLALGTYAVLTRKRRGNVRRR